MYDSSVNRWTEWLDEVRLINGRMRLDEMDGMVKMRGFYYIYYMMSNEILGFISEINCLSSYSENIIYYNEFEKIPYIHWYRGPYRKSVSTVIYVALVGVPIY